MDGTIFFFLFWWIKLILVAMRLCLKLRLFIPLPSVRRYHPSLESCQKRNSSNG